MNSPNLEAQLANLLKERLLEAMRNPDTHPAPIPTPYPDRGPAPPAPAPRPDPKPRPK